MNLGAFLRTYRTAQHLTQKEMAAKIDVSREYYSRLEQGVREPSVALLERICSSTEIPAEQLFKRKDGTPLSGNFLEMCKLCLSLRQGDRKEIQRLMKRMLK